MSDPGSKPVTEARSGRGPVSGRVAEANPLCGPAEPLVRAAGGVLWRRRRAGIQVVLVHRPRYDDWTIPKGKLEPGESDEGAAVREVEEETSVVGRLGAELPATTYIDRSGRTKRVRYWAMTPVSGTPSGANEVDEARWLDLDEARRRLSYGRDREILDALLPTIGPEPASTEI